MSNFVQVASNLKKNSLVVTMVKIKLKYEFLSL